MHAPLRSLLTVLVLLAAALVSPAGDTAPDRCLAPYFVVKADRDGADRFPLKSTRVTAEIAGVIADVRVVQTYENRGPGVIEATYVFPASTRAAVHGLTMTVGGRRVVAKIKERGEARRTYEQAKAAGKTASLLEQERPNVFQMNLANILPGDVVEVELAYTELLVPAEGVYEWCYPTTVGPRYSNRAAATAAPDEQWVANPYLPAGSPAPAGFTLEARLVPGMPLQEVASPTHRVAIDFRNPAEATVQLSPDEVSPANRDFLLHYRLAGDAIAGGLVLDEDAADGGHFLLMLAPPPRPPVTMIPPRDFLFVVDVSGSMNGFPLATAKTLVRELAVQLRSQDRFNVLLFAGDSQVLAPASLPATPENVAAALELLERQQGGGGTELVAAMRRALALPATAGAARIVAVITDGYVDMEPELFELVRANLGRSSVFAFGIGTSVNRHLIEGLARAGRGEPFVVTDNALAASGAAAFRAMIEAPVLTGVQVDFGGLAVSEVAPLPVPDLFARRPVVLTGRYRGKPVGTITVGGRTGEKPWNVAVDVAGASRLTSPGIIGRLWARQRIAELADLQALALDEGRRQAIVALGIAHNLLTNYTSFVAVDEVVRRAPGEPVRTVAQPSVLPEGVSNLAVGGGEVATTPEPATVLLVFISAAAIGLALWRIRPVQQGV